MCGRPAAGASAASALRPSPVTLTGPTERMGSDADLVKWLTDSAHLQEAGLQTAREAFMAHKITSIEPLRLATMDSLQLTYGIKPWGVRAKIMRALKGLDTVDSAKSGTTARPDAEKAEQERLDAAKAQQERLYAQKAEQERLDAAKAKQERLDAAKAEQERLNVDARDNSFDCYGNHGEVGLSPAKSDPISYIHEQPVTPPQSPESKQQQWNNWIEKAERELRASGHVNDVAICCTKTYYPWTRAGLEVQKDEIEHIMDCFNRQDPQERGVSIAGEKYGPVKSHGCGGDWVGDLDGMHGASHGVRNMELSSRSAPTSGASIFLASTRTEPQALFIATYTGEMLRDMNFKAVCEKAKELEEFWASQIYSMVD